MALTGSRVSDGRGASETLGVAVLIGMTILVTAGLGLGVLVISDQEQEQTAEVDFTFLSDSMIVVYQDETERPAGNLYIDGPANNVSWAELDGEMGDDEMVTDGSNVELSTDSPYGARPDEDDRFDLVFITEEGQRYVLASLNADDDPDPGESPVGPDDTDPPGP